MKQLVDDGILAVTAGSDTTASALTSIFFCLLTHPDVYSLLREEVDRFEGSILVYSIDVTKEWHSRRAGYRSGHAAAEEKVL